MAVPISLVSGYTGAKGVTMKRGALAVLVLFCMCVVVAAGDVTETNRVLAAHEELGKTPEGALQLWFEAVYLYMDENTRDQGREALTYLTIPFKDDAGWERRSSNRIFVERLQDPKFAHIFRSYVKGTSPSNAYSMSPENFDLVVEESSKDAHGRGWRVLLRSSGADMPRPVYMKKSRSTGLWYVSEFANVYVGIRPPVDSRVESFE